MILFYGALWGLVEATVGHALHILPVRIGWLIWFPIAFFFLQQSYAHTGKKSSVILVALLASLIKLINLLNPVRLDFVLNPAVSIILEGLVVFAALKLLEKARISAYPLYILAVNTGWRVLYIVYALGMPQAWRNISPISSWDAFIQFFIIENIATGVMILLGFIVYTKLADHKQKPKREYAVHPLLSVVILAITVYIQWALCT